MPASQTLLIFVGAPLGLFTAIATIVWATTAPKGGGAKSLDNSVDRPDWEIH